MADEFPSHSVTFRRDVPSMSDLAALVASLAVLGFDELQVMTTDGVFVVFASGPDGLKSREEQAA